MHPYQRDFIDLALARDVLRFGEFTLKSGRQSPYFFNLGRIDSGAALARLGEAYAAAMARAEGGTRGPLPRLALRDHAAADDGEGGRSLLCALPGAICIERDTTRCPGEVHPCSWQFLE